MNVVAPERPLDTAPIDGLLRLIVGAWNPDCIWLFGSRARGTAEPDSDWDLLVVVPDSQAQAATDPVAGWDLARRARVRADVVACAASDFKAFANVPNTLAYEALHHGVLLRER